MVVETTIGYLSDAGLSGLGEPGTCVADPFLRGPGAGLDSIRLGGQSSPFNRIRLVFTGPLDDKTVTAPFPGF